MTAPSTEDKKSVSPRLVDARLIHDARSQLPPRNEVFPPPAWSPQDTNSKTAQGGTSDTPLDSKKKGINQNSPNTTTTKRHGEPTHLLNIHTHTNYTPYDHPSSPTAPPHGYRSNPSYSPSQHSPSPPVKATHPATEYSSRPYSPPSPPQPIYKGYTTLVGQSVYDTPPRPPAPDSPTTLPRSVWLSYCSSRIAAWRV